MKSYADLVADAKARIQEVPPQEVAAMLRSPARPVVIDLREPNEWNLGHIPGATLVELPGGEGLFGSDSETVAGEIHRFLRQRCGPHAQGRKGVVAVRQRAGNASSAVGGAQRRLPSR